MKWYRGYDWNWWAQGSGKHDYRKDNLSKTELKQTVFN